MKTSPVLLVGMDEVAQAAAAKAVRLAFPAATMTVVSSIEEALQASAPGGADLIMFAPAGAADAVKASSMLDEQDLPRWAVVVDGGPVSSNSTITTLPEDQQPEVRAETLRHVLGLHQLRRDNARLRGDLHTIASRLNHDLRTPLSPIYTSCEVLRITLGDQVETHAPVIQAITNSVDELTSLLDRVSFVLKASVNPKPKEKVQMGDSVFGAMARLESRSLAAKAVITPAKQWPEVRGVPLWLETMWWHLLANALQHGAAVPRIDLGWDESDTQYRFWVQNAGKEIPVDKRRKLFQPFHQLHQTNASRGLGLSLVRRLAELQGGSCGYEPLGSQGSRFFFTLPKE